MEMEMEIEMENSESSPEYIYSVTEEYLKEIEQALDYAWNNFDTYIDPLDIEAIINDPELSNPPPEMVLPPPPPPPPLFSPPSIIIPNTNNDNNNNAVYKRFEELDLQHRELMEMANQVEKAVDYLMIYYYLRKNGSRPPNHDELNSTVEWFTDRMNTLEKSYRSKLLMGSDTDTDTASHSCLDLMILKFRHMKLMTSASDINC
ncbi:hypothetical protein ACP275_11G124800 [Erythranthe tilingii]